MLGARLLGEQHPVVLILLFVCPQIIYLTVFFVSIDRFCFRFYFRILLFELPKN